MNKSFIPNNVSGIVLTLQQEKVRLNSENVRLIKRRNFKIAKNGEKYGKKITALEDSLKKLHINDGKIMKDHELLLEVNNFLKIKI